MGAADVPAGFVGVEAANAPDASQGEPGAQGPESRGIALPAEDSRATVSPTTEAPALDAPVNTPAPAEPAGRASSWGPEPAGAVFRPPATSLGEIAWSSLGTGSRVVVWLVGPPYRCLVLDIVDPSTGEALLYEVATVDADGRPIATAGPPRRVIVGRDEAGRPRGSGLVRGSIIHVAEGGVAGHARVQALGPIAALILDP